MTTVGNGLSMRKQGRQASGQAMFETIVAIVLIALAIVVIVRVYGKTILKAYSCATKSIQQGQGLSLTCPGQSTGDQEDSKGGDSTPGNQASTPGGPGGDVAPEPGGGSGGGSGDAAKDQKLKDARDILNSTATGKDIVKFLDSSGVTIELKGGDGSFFDSKNNHIVINDAKNAEQIALTTAHEANHARFAKEGKTANAKTDTRDEFVRKMIDEEAIGTVASIELKNELKAAGKNITARYPLESEFNAAHDKAIENLKNTNPKATQTELDGAGNAAGLDAVRDGFNSGKVVTSNTKEKYPDYYAKQFDAKRAAKGPEPGASGDDDDEAKPEPSGSSGGVSQEKLVHAVDFLHDVDPGFANGLADNFTVIQIKNADGSSKFFQVTHPFEEINDDRFGHVPEHGVIRNSGKVVTDRIDAGTADKPRVPDLVVDGNQSTADVALAVFREQRRAQRERDDPKFLDDSIANGQDDPAKARDQFVKTTIDRIVDRNLEQIRLKDKLEAKGATVSTPLLLEPEFTKARQKAFLEELSRSGDQRKALTAADAAGEKAVRDAVENGGVRSHTNEKYPDYFGKQFDDKQAEFAKQHPDIVKQKTDERKRKEAIAALVNLVNKVDPNSKEADQVIQLIDATVPLLSGAEQTFFINDANEGLERLLGPFGFRTVEGVNVAGLQQDRLEYALAVFATTKPDVRKELRRDPFGPLKHGIHIQPTAAELAAEGRLVAVRKLDDGTLHVGPLSEFKEAQEQARINHALEQIDQIVNAGPLSLLGRVIDGERGAVIGAGLDAGLPVLAAARQRGFRGSGNGGADFETGPRGKPVPAEIGEPPVRNRDEELPSVRPARGQGAAKVDPNAKTQPKEAFDKTQPAPPAKPQEPAKPAEAPKPPRVVGKNDQTGAGGSDTGNKSIAKRQQDEQIADQKRAAEESRRAKENFKKDLSNPKPIFKGPKPEGAGEAVGVDKALKDAEDGKVKLITSGNTKSHELFFKDEIRVRDGEKAPPAPVAFRESGNRIRIDDSQLNDAQLGRLRKIVANEEAAKQGGGGSSPRGGGNGGAGGSPDPKAKTELDKTRPAPPPRGQSQTKPDANKGNNTARREDTSRQEKKTGEITRPGAEKNTQAKAEPGPGKFGEEDVAFGLAKARGKNDALAKFAGKALNGGKLPISEAVKNGKPTKEAINEAVAGETVSAAKAVLNTTKGKLRFSLDGFDVKQALDPKSENFNSVTAFEFRKVLADPFFQGRVTFFDENGKDITAEILSLRGSK